MKNIFTFVVTTSTVCFVISQLNNFHNHYNARRRSYERARKYLQTENCINTRVIADLGDFNLCDEAEQIMDKPPLVKAIVDTAEDINICGKGYCEVLGHNITNSMPQIMLTLLIAIGLFVWALIVQYRQDRRKKAEEYYDLSRRAHLCN